MVRIDHIWGLPNPVELGELDRRPAIATDPRGQFVLQSREYDAHPARIFSYQDSQAGEMEMLELRDLWRLTNGCAPIQLYTPSEQMLVWSNDFLTGTDGDNVRTGWETQNSPDITASAEVPPDGYGIGTVYRLGAPTNNSPRINQYIGELRMRDSYTVSCAFLEDNAGTVAIGFKKQDIGAADMAEFDWSGGVLTVGTVDPLLTGAAVTDIGRGWYRAQVTLPPATYAPGKDLRVRVDGAVDAPQTGKGTYIWGAQCVQGDAPGIYRVAKGYRRGAVAVVLDGEAMQIEQMSGTRYHLAATLREVAA